MQRDMTWGVGVQDRKVTFGNGEIVSHITSTTDLVTVLKNIREAPRLVGSMELSRDFVFQKFLTHFAGYPTAVIQHGLEVPLHVPYIASKNIYVRSPQYIFRIM